MPIVKTPNYVRDNIHVDLLAKYYGDFVENLQKGLQILRPRGYVESQLAFTQRFTKEMSQRLPYQCIFDVQEQQQNVEPLILANRDSLLREWDETSAWDNLAHFYMTDFKHKLYS